MNGPKDACAMRIDLECKATAAVLRSGSTLALAGHTAALMAVIALSWITIPALLTWSVVIYLSIRVKLDVEFFDLLLTQPPESLDEWLKASGLRANLPPDRSIADRRIAALTLWRKLAAAVALEIALVLFSVLLKMRS